MYSFIALEVTQTFGGAQTYMNRVFLYSDEVTASPTSSRDGQSSISGSEYNPALPNSHLGNVSDLSVRTPEKEQEQPARVSHDTEQLVAQLQAALGLRTALDDSYYSDDHAEEDRNFLPAKLLESSSPATVAGRLASLESTVHALEHTLLEHYPKPSGPSVQPARTPNVSFVRSPTPPSRAHSRSHSPAASLSSERRAMHIASSDRTSNAHTVALDESSRVAMVTDRLSSIEEKFTRLLDTLESSSNAPRNAPSKLPPPPPPPPPLPLSLPSPRRSPSPVRSVANSQSSHLRSRSSSIRSPPSSRARWSSSASSLNKATLPPRHSQSPHMSPVRESANADASARVMEQVVRSVETMMHRVLAQHEHKHTQQQHMSSIDSTINSSSAFDASTEIAPQEFLRQQRQRFVMSPPRIKSSSGSASRSRADGVDKSGVGGETISSSGRAALGSYISTKAERLLRAKRERERKYEEERKGADALAASLRHHRELASHTNTNNSHIPQSSRVRAAMRERPHVKPRSESPGSVDSHSSSGNDSSSSRSEEGEGGAARRGKTHAKRSSRRRSEEALDAESHSVLERSIFELLKSKYGLGVPADAAQDATFTTASTAAALPMRIPIKPSVVHTAVVDWPQYVKNRVESGAGGSRRERVNSVGGTVVNSSDNVDVMPRARQNLRDSRRERAHQQAAARDRSLSPLRAESHAAAAMEEPRSLRSRSASPSRGDGTAASLPAWCEQDAEMAELVRALHEKVYQRTVKEAQYDMLLLSAQR